MTVQDPWNKTNFKKSLEEKAQEYQGIIGAVQAMDGELLAKVARALKEEGSPLPNYSLIDRTSPQFSQDKLGRVFEIIKNHYRLDNEFSPLKDSYDGTKADSLTNAAVFNLYFGHAQTLMDSLGQKNFSTVMNTLMSNNLQRVTNRLEQDTSLGYNTQMHGEHATDILVDVFGADRAKLDLELLKHVAPQAIGNYVAGRTSTDVLYALAPKKPTPGG